MNRYTEVITSDLCIFLSCTQEIISEIVGMDDASCGISRLVLVYIATCSIELLLFQLLCSIKLNCNDLPSNLVSEQKDVTFNVIRCFHCKVIAPRNSGAIVSKIPVLIKYHINLKSTGYQSSCQKDSML